MITEAIILAGGLGTRLREAVPDLPKCMAPVNGRPFVYYVIHHLQQQGVRRFVFSLGYRSEDFTRFIESTLEPGSYELVIEKEPLGTGGAIRLACDHTKEEDVVVVNGDSIFKSDIKTQYAFHRSSKAECTLALKRMQQIDRYGVVEIHDDGAIALFKEKQFYAEGLINAGFYLLNVPSFITEDFPEKFSFETDYLQRYYTQKKIYGQEQQSYFIDIGIPGDYARAQHELNEE